MNSLGKVSSAKDRQRLKLSSLKRSLSANELTSDERITRLQSQLQAVTDDLKSTKGTLDEVSRREKQASFSKCFFQTILELLCSVTPYSPVDGDLRASLKCAYGRKQ